MINECAECGHKFPPHVDDGTNDDFEECCPVCRSYDIIYDADALDAELEEEEPVGI